MNNNDAGKKLFPWRCTNCRHQSVYGAVVDYVTTRHHEGKSYPIEIHGLKTPKCTNCGLVAPDSEALETITRAFLAEAKLLTPHEICECRTRSNLTQGELAAALGVTEGMVALWEDGGIQPRALDNLMRLFFGIPQVRQLLTTRDVSSLAHSA